jgi:anti-sigma28 factor (negative regulator of flagellin synthesis)
MKSAYNAAIVDLSENIKLDKDWPTRLVQEYDMGKTKYNLQKEANLIKQKYMIQETAAQNIKNQLKPSNENEKIEELKRKPMNGQFYWDLERSSVDKEKSLTFYVAQAQKKWRL